MIRLFSFVLSSILFGVSFASAAPDPNSYRQAVQAKILVDAMKRAIPPVAIKQALLDGARAEDRGFVKSMLINWKHYPAENIHTEFNHLFLRDRTGTVVLRIAPVENAAGSFLINGKLWTVPENGSITHSLKNFFSKKLANGLWGRMLITPANAALSGMGPTIEETLAYFAASAMSNKDTDQSSLAQLKGASPRPFLLPPGSDFWQNVVESIGFGRPVKVNCSAETASGRLVLSENLVDFTVARDGTVTLIPLEKSSRHSSFRANFSENGDISYSSCTDSNCEKISSEPKQSLKSFLKISNESAVDIASTFRTLKTEVSKTYPIEFGCKPLDECEAIDIKDLEKMAPEDRARAKTIRMNALKAIRNTKAAHNAILRSIRPLYSCCQDKPCVDAVLSSGLKLVSPLPAAVQTATKK